MLLRFVILLGLLKLHAQVEGRSLLQEERTFIFDPNDPLRPKPIFPITGLPPKDGKPLPSKDAKPKPPVVVLPPKVEAPKHEPNYTKPAPHPKDEAKPKPFPQRPVKPQPSPSHGNSTKTKPTKTYYPKVSPSPPHKDMTRPKPSPPSPHKNVTKPKPSPSPAPCAPSNVTKPKPSSPPLVIIKPSPSPRPITVIPYKPLPEVVNPNKPKPNPKPEVVQPQRPHPVPGPSPYPVQPLRPHICKLQKRWIPGAPCIIRDFISANRGCLCPPPLDPHGDRCYRKCPSGYTEVGFEKNGIRTCVQVPKGYEVCNKEGAAYAVPAGHTRVCTVLVDSTMNSIPYCSN